jgi:hypothetical protein
MARSRTLVGREPDGVGHAMLLQRLVEGRDGKGRVGSDDDGLPPDLGPLNDRKEDLLPPVRTVDVIAAGSLPACPLARSLPIRQTRR